MKQTKTGYVLSLPNSMPAKDVVAKGKAAGVALTVGHVYAIRAKKRAKGGAKGHAKGAAKVSHASSGAAKHHTVGNHKVEDLLRAVAAEIGLAQAMSILKAEHDRVHRILGN